MNNRKYFAVGIILTLFTIFLCSFPERIEAQESKQDVSKNIITLEEYMKHGYTHNSPRYGYSIVCPEKPKGVIPLSLLDEKLKGELLIFEGGENLQVDKGWVILLNAFKEEAIPDLKNISSEKEKEIVHNLIATNSYEFVRIVEFNDNKGVYIMTAKDKSLGIDLSSKTDEKDMVKVQLLKTFFRTEDNTRYAFELLERPKLTENSIAEYHMGLLSFRALVDF